MNVLEVLYREVVYRRMRDNPRSAGELSLKLTSSGDLKKALLFQTGMYAVFGLMLFPSLRGERDAVLVMASAYALLPFVIAFYATVTNSGYIASLDLFKPLLPLPVRLGGRYMSALLLLESLPTLTFMLPGAIKIGARRFGDIGSSGASVVCGWPDARPRFRSARLLRLWKDLLRKVCRS